MIRQLQNVLGINCYIFTMNISLFFSWYFFWWIFKMFFGYWLCSYIVYWFDPDIFIYSFPILGFLVGLFNYQFSWNYLRQIESELSNYKGTRLIFFIFIWLLAALIAFLLFTWFLWNISIKSNYRLSINWFLFFFSLPFGAVIGSYAQFLRVSKRLSHLNKSMIFCCALGSITMFTLYSLWNWINKQSYSDLIGLNSSSKTQEMYKLPKLDPTIEKIFAPLLKTNLDDTKISNDWVLLTQTFRSEDGDLSIKFPDGKIQQMDIGDDGKSKVYTVEIGSYNSKDYIFYVVYDFTFQLPLQLNERSVHKLTSGITDVLIGLRNDSQIKDNMLLWELIAKKIPWKLQSYWFKQNILFNDTAYVLEWILKAEGNSARLIDTAIFYPVTINPNAEEFFNSFQFHSMVLKPTTSIKTPVNNLVIAPKLKSSTSGEVLIKKSSVSGEVLVR